MQTDWTVPNMVNTRAERPSIDGQDSSELPPTSIPQDEDLNGKLRARLASNPLLHPAVPTSRAECPLFSLELTQELSYII